MKTLHFDTWQGFRDFVENGQQELPVYWRGQRDPAWPLASQFERLILSLNGGWKKGASQIYPYAGRYQSVEQQKWLHRFIFEMRDGYLERFRRAASGLRGPTPQDLAPYQWWVLGRHYGLITPLLDWTTKPYIAAFFALAELIGKSMYKGKSIRHKEVEVAVYQLVHKRGMKSYPPSSYYIENDTAQYDKDYKVGIDPGLWIVRPTVDELGRLQGQRGVFTWLVSGEHFELQGYLDDVGFGDFLTQIILSGCAIQDGLIDLDNHGLDYRLLFPDLSGAALTANVPDSDEKKLVGSFESIRVQANKYTKRPKN